MTKTIRQLSGSTVAMPLLVLIAVAARLPRLNRNFWFDEIHYSTRARWSNLAEMLEVALHDKHGVLYPTLMFFWTALGGERELLIRLPSLTFGIGSILLAYILCRRFAGDAAAMAAGIFLCFSPAHVWYSQEATPYAMLMFMCMATVVVLYHGADRGMPARWLVMYALLLIGAVATHPFAAALLVPLTIAALGFSGHVRKQLLVVNGAVATAVAAAFAYQVARNYETLLLLLSTGVRAPSFLRPFTLIELWMLFFNWFLLGNAVWPVLPYAHTTRLLVQHIPLLFIQIVAAILLVRGLFGNRGTNRHRSLVLSALVLTLPVVLLMQSATIGHLMYVERYLLLVLPFFAIALARGITTFHAGPLRSLSALLLVAFSIAGYAGWAGKPDKWTVYKPNPDWESAVIMMKSDTLLNGPSMVIGGIPLADFAFYTRRHLRNPPRMDRSYDLDFAFRSDPSTTIYLVDNRWWHGDFNWRFDRVSRHPDMRQVSVLRTPTVTIYTFRHASATR